jgi:uncharacterized protein YkwD
MQTNVRRLVKRRVLRKEFDALIDPQSEISAYRKSYSLPAVTADAKLTELARQQANAMAERRSMDHNVYASFHSRIAPYGSASAAENLATGTKTVQGDARDVEILIWS